jgi:glycosyl transferase family (putative galactosyltransferase)
MYLSDRPLEPHMTIRILILQVMTPEIAGYCAYSLPLNVEYAVKNGYHYYLHHARRSDIPYHPSWLKLEALRLVDLQSYNWIWVLDADCVINNISIKLEDVIAADPKDIIISENGRNGGRRINAGSFVLRSSAVPLALAQYDAFARSGSPYMNKKFWEQEMFNDWYERDPTIFSVRDMNVLNSYWNIASLRGEERNNLVFHYMAQSDEQRITAMKNYWVLRNFFITKT